jgi:hypothetical protein
MFPSGSHMLHFGRYQESVHTHLYLKLSTAKSGVKFRQKKFSFFKIMGMQGSFVDIFESRRYYVHILVSENEMMSTTNLHQLSKYKEEVRWVVE